MGLLLVFSVLLPIAMVVVHIVTFLALDGRWRGLSLLPLPAAIAAPFAVFAIADYRPVLMVLAALVVWIIGIVLAYVGHARWLRGQQAQQPASAATQAPPPTA